MANIYVDGTDLAGIFKVEMVVGHRSMPQVDRPKQSVPGRIGPVLLSTVPLYKERTITVDGHVLGDTMADMWANLNELNARLVGGVHEVVVADDTTRLFNAYLSGTVGQPLRPALWASKTRVTAKLVCYDPRAYSTAGSTLGFGSTDTAVPLGTAPSGGVVRISGAASAPVLIYKSSTGLELARVTLATTLSSTQWVDVDLDTYLLTDEAGNPASTLWASSASEFFWLDPGDGAWASTSWPTVQVTAGSGALTYTKAWW